MIISTIKAKRSITYSNLNKYNKSSHRFRLITSVSQYKFISYNCQIKNKFKQTSTSNRPTHSKLNRK